MTLRTCRVAAFALVATILAACGTTGAGPSLAPSAAATLVAATSSPPPSAAAPEATLGTPCIDVATLADIGDPVEMTVQSITATLISTDVAKARTAAKDAADGMRKIATFVGTASPDAATAFTTAADELEQAAAQFPAGADLVTKAHDDLEAAFRTARASYCP